MGFHEVRGNKSFCVSKPECFTFSLSALFHFDLKTVVCALLRIASCRSSPKRGARDKTSSGAAGGAQAEGGPEVKWGPQGRGGCLLALHWAQGVVIKNTALKFLVLGEI